LDPKLKSLIEVAARRGASDLHLEAGLPPAVRVRGRLHVQGEPLPARALLNMAREITPPEKWSDFVQQKSCDFSRRLGGSRCRVNVLQTARGVGLAIRLLLPVEPTLKQLNLNPDLLKVLERPNGLVLFSGPTGCGKSSTMAALIQELNLRRALHIITIESPIEYHLTPRFSFIRQREVGRDTPSFYQGLLDTLREDPDLVMIGEMRDTDTMQATIRAAETGHLVFATVHAGSVLEAVQRVVSSFPPQGQDGIRAVLADCLAAVVCQRMLYRPERKLRVPECEILLASDAARAVIRQGSLKNLSDIVQTGLREGMWTFERYRAWLDQKPDWSSSGAMGGPDPSPRGADGPWEAPAAGGPMAVLNLEEDGGAAPAPALRTRRNPDPPGPAEKPGARAAGPGPDPAREPAPGVAPVIEISEALPGHGGGPVDLLARGLHPVPGRDPQLPAQQAQVGRLRQGLGVVQLPGHGPHQEDADHPALAVGHERGEREHVLPAVVPVPHHVEPVVHVLPGPAALQVHPDGLHVQAFHPSLGFLVAGLVPGRAERFEIVPVDPVHRLPDGHAQGEPLDHARTRRRGRRAPCRRLLLPRAPGQDGGGQRQRRRGKKRGGPVRSAAAGRTAVPRSIAALRSHCALSLAAFPGARAVRPAPGTFRSTRPAGPPAPRGA